MATDHKKMAMVLGLPAPDDMDAGSPDSGEGDQEDPALMSAATDLIAAVHSKDVQGVADALKAAALSVTTPPPEDESQEPEPEAAPEE